MPEEVVHVRYNEQLIRDAVRAFVWRRFFLEQKPLWVLAGAMLVLSLWQFEKGERLWAIIPGIGALLPLLFVLAGWLAHRSVASEDFALCRNPRPNSHLMTMDFE